MMGHKEECQGISVTVFVGQFEGWSEAVSSYITLGKSHPVEPSLPPGLFDQWRSSTKW